MEENLRTRSEIEQEYVQTGVQLGDIVVKSENSIAQLKAKMKALLTEKSAPDKEPLPE
jgi:hypothetical protein